MEVIILGVSLGTASDFDEFGDTGTIYHDVESEIASIDGCDFSFDYLTGIIETYCPDTGEVIKTMDYKEVIKA